MQSVFNTLVPRPVGTDSHVSGRLLTKQHLVFFTLLLYVHLLFGLLLLHSSMEHCKTCGWCIFKADTMSPDHSFIIAIIRFWPPAWDLVHVCRFPHLNLFLQLLVQFCQQSEFIGILYNLQEYNQQAAVLAYFKETNSARMQKKDTVSSWFWKSQRRKQPEVVHFKLHGLRWWLKTQNCNKSPSYFSLFFPYRTLKYNILHS